MKFLLYISILFLELTAAVYAQEDTLVWEDHSESPDTWLYRWSGPRFYQTESSIGIVPSIQGVNELYLGIGVSKARFVMGEGGGSGLGATLGFDYNPIDNIMAPKLNVWATGFAFFFGGNVGVSGFYYVKNKATNFVLRPEIGLGYLKVFLNYGYNFFLRDDFEGVSRHTLTLSYYHTFLPFRKKN